ncbi:MAG: phosphoglucomutase/phosphomannomutase family protein [Deltaproteobacteria bacterium]|nr:phosphoglucomutase/phosphomannomutase family protein [Deltaproteobacteria bacterium]
MKIKFGTDGWRAVIGRDFTYENVAQLVQAFCDFKSKEKNKKIILGYDRRFCSQDFAKEAACVLLANGFFVEMSEKYVPTPLISCRVVEQKALAGIMVTASHNPYKWNGIKIKEKDGGSASASYVQGIEAQIQKNQKQGRKIKRLDIESAIRKKQFRYFDPFSFYLKKLSKFVDLDLIKKSKLRIVFDAMHGSGTGFLKELLGKQVIEIRSQEDPFFGGVNPEPIEKNLLPLKSAIKKENAYMGLVTDGDADRIGAMDEKGHFISAQQIFALLLEHLLRERRWKGQVVKTVSTTLMVDRLCETFSIPLLETPIGFKHICQAFRENKVLIGGEESGGIGIPRHVSERDGLLCALLLLEISAQNPMPFSKLIQKLQKNYGPLHYRREDLSLSTQHMKSIMQKLKKCDAQSFAAIKLDKKDGWKFYFSDQSWLLIRPSGTEPLLRVYAEAPKKKRTDQLIEYAKKFVEH